MGGDLGMSKVKDCGNCGYNLGSKCKVMREKQVDCFAWADAREVQKREKAISEYECLEEKARTNRDLKKQRKGKAVTEVLDKKFMKLYEQGLTDLKIAEKLKVSASSVALYRNNLGLKSSKKISLLAQAIKK
jgi:FixJ family two-component response regulator